MNTINFAHANGFPAGSYKKLFDHLSSSFRIIALDKYGHTSQYPVSNNWPHLIKEMNDYVEKNATSPVISIGHSFGALLSYLAVCQRPELYKGLIMLDPPLATGFRRYVLKMAKNMPIIDKITPAKKAVKRRRHWPKNTEVMESFAKRSFFKYFDDECLADYVKAAIKPRNNRLELDFCADIEANIFRHMPDNLNKYAGKLTVPSILLTGKHTNVCLPKYAKPFIKQNGIEHRQCHFGGHMFPLEEPENTAKNIINVINEWY